MLDLNHNSFLAGIALGKQLKRWARKNMGGAYVTLEWKYGLPHKAKSRAHKINSWVTVPIDMDEIGTERPDDWIE